MYGAAGSRGQSPVRVGSPTFCDMTGILFTTQLEMERPKLDRQSTPWTGFSLVSASDRGRGAEGIHAVYDQAAIRILFE